MIRAQSAMFSGVAAAILQACSAGPEFSRVMGEVQLHDDPVEAVVPPSWAEGVEFLALVTTYGGCHMEQGDTEVVEDGLRAVVTPYDLVEIDPDNPNCPDVLFVWTHTAGVTFRQRGQATVVFRGRRFPGGDTVEVERTIQIF